MHPLVELVINPFAGHAGVNMVGMMFWATIIISAIMWYGKGRWYE